MMLIIAQSNLEFELRLQQYIELARSQQYPKLIEAQRHAQKYLTTHSDPKYPITIAGLLAFSPDTHHQTYTVKLSFSILDCRMELTRIVSLFRQTLGDPLRSLLKNASHTTLDSFHASSACRPISWPLRLENPIMSFNPFIIVLQL